MQKVVAALADPEAARAPGSTPTDPASAAQQAIQTIAVIESTLFPAYRRAVDALDPAAAVELASRLVQATKSIEHDNTLVATAVEISHDSLELRALDGLLRGQTKLLEVELLTKIGPQYFRGAPVVGPLEMPHPGGRIADYLAAEAGTMVELLSVVRQVDDIRGTARSLQPDQRQEIARLVEPWHSRPANFAFLVRVLKDEALWSQVANEETDGETLAKTEIAVDGQRRATGVLADVGELDAERLRGLLEDDVSDFGEHTMTDDGRAHQIFESLTKVPPAARGALLRQIHRSGHLPWFCQHVPRFALDELNKSLIGFDAEAAVLLNPFIVDGGGDGRSMRQIYMDQVDDAAKRGNVSEAYDWFLLERIHNTATFGFEQDYSAAYEANNAGLTTHDEFRSDATKALGKAAAIALASSATGGVTGAFGEGVAAGVGASRSVGQIISAGAGGFGAGVGGHLAGDVYDQTLNGKQGFDSFGSYMQSGAEAGIMGTLLGGLSVGAGKYLGEAQRPIDTVAGQHPTLAGVLERIRGAGIATGKSAAATASKIRMTVAELLELVDSGFGKAFAADAAAILGHPVLRRVPPSTPVDVSIRPLAMSGNDPKPPAHGGSSGSSPTVAIDEVAAVKASPAETVDETVNAYEDAKNGGHFAQYLERYRTLPTRQLLAERTELMKAIGESERALRDPERWGHMAHDPDFMDTLFGGLNDRIKMDTIWKNIIDGVLRERGATEPS